MKKTEKEKYEERIRQLEEQLKKAVEDKSEQADVEEGTGANLLETLGRSLGLSSLIKSVSKMPEFQDRLAEIDEELRIRLSEGYSGKEASPRKYSGLGIRRGIPPRAGARRPRRRTKRTREESPPEPSRQVDIFDEDDHVLVVCEIPGSEKDKIHVNLDKDKLSIVAETIHRKGGSFQKEIVLPSVPKGEQSQSYHNDILRVKIMKKAKA